MWNDSFIVNDIKYRVEFQNDEFDSLEATLLRGGKKWKLTRQQCDENNQHDTVELFKDYIYTKDEFLREWTIIFPKQYDQDNISIEIVEKKTNKKFVREYLLLLYPKSLDDTEQLSCRVDGLKEKVCQTSTELESIREQISTDKDKSNSDMEGLRKRISNLETLVTCRLDRVEKSVESTGEKLDKLSSVITCLQSQIGQYRGHGYDSSGNTIYCKHCIRIE